MPSAGRRLPHFDSAYIFFSGAAAQDIFRREREYRVQRRDDATSAECRAFIEVMRSLRGRAEICAC